MGANLVITRKNGPEEGGFEAEQNDRKFLVAYLPQLEKMAAELKVRSLKSFFDEAGAEYDLYEEIHGEEAPENWLEENRQWFDPAEAIVSLQAILNHINQTKPAFFKMGHDEAVIRDLKDCLTLLQTLEADKDLFCFSIYI